MSKKKAVQLSIVIPSYKRAHLLSVLLDSLCRQSMPLDCFEVIVVDNAPQSDLDTVRTCREEKFHPLRISYVHHPILGASEARNKGISLAHGDLIGFLDDDMLVPENWVAKVLSTHTEKQADIFGGPCPPYFTAQKPTWFRDGYITNTYGDKARWLAESEYLFGGDMIWKRTCLDQAGGFPLTGRVGDNLEYGEETALQQRAVSLGARIWYDPELFAYHHAPCERMTVAWLFKSRWFHGKAKAGLYLRQNRGEIMRAPTRALLSWLKTTFLKMLEMTWLLFKILFRNRVQFPYYQNYLIEVINPHFSGFSLTWHLIQEIGSGKSLPQKILTAAPLPGAPVENHDIPSPTESTHS